MLMVEMVPCFLYHLLKKHTRHTVWSMNAPTSQDTTCRKISYQCMCPYKKNITSVYDLKLYF